MGAASRNGTDLIAAPLEDLFQRNPTFAAKASFLSLGDQPALFSETNQRIYGMSQSRRAMIECIFGWGKQHGTMRKTKHRGLARVAADFLLNLIGYNLIRIPKLLAT